jgi:hypothetical protein
MPRRLCSPPATGDLGTKAADAAERWLSVRCCAGGSGKLFPERTRVGRVTSSAAGVAAGAAVATDVSTSSSSTSCVDVRIGGAPPLFAAEPTSADGWRRARSSLAGVFSSGRGRFAERLPEWLTLRLDRTSCRARVSAPEPSAHSTSTVSPFAAMATTQAECQLPPHFASTASPGCSGAAVAGVAVFLRLGDADGGMAGWGVASGALLISSVVEGRSSGASS